MFKSVRREKITAAIVSETFTSSLEPITSQAPRLLLPIANTPLIDYMLENLVVNGIDEVFIFCYSGHTEITHHINSVITASGKPWSQSREIKVRPMACDRSSVKSLTDLFADIVRKNVLSGPFIFVPCDSICNITNLKEMYAHHLARVETDRTAILTMIAAADRGALKSTHRKITMNHYREQHHPHNHHHHHHHGNHDGDGQLHQNPMTPMTRLASLGSFEFQGSTVDEEEVQHTRRFSVVLETGKPDTTGNASLAYQSWDDERRFGSLVLDPSIMGKKSFKVRTDLINTGFYICQPDVLTLLNAAAPEQNMADLLRHVYDNVEVEGNRFAVAVAPENTVVGYLNTALSYVATTVAVVERHFFPMTRESNFAEANPSYLVSREVPTVYLFERKVHRHQSCDTRLLLNQNTDTRDVVVGIHTMVPESCRIEKTVLGRNVKIGKNVKLSGCVILNDVVIGDNAEIHYSVIGSHTLISEDTFIGNNCIIGSHVQLKASRPIVLPAGTRLVFHPTHPTSSHFSTEKGCGELFVPGGKKEPTVPPLSTLFTQDAAAQDDEEEEEIGGEDDSVERNFLDGITGTIERVLNEGMTVDNMMNALKFTMLSYHRVRAELAGGVLRVVIRIVLRDQLAQGVTKGSKIMKAILAALRQVNHCFLDLDADADSACHPVLEQLSQALAEAGLESPIASKADGILAFLYWEMDDEIFEKNGYCAVSAQSIVKFDDYLRQLQEGGGDDEGDDELSSVDKAQIEGWSLLSEYVDQVRESLKPKKKKKKKKAEEE